MVYYVERYLVYIHTCGRTHTHARTRTHAHAHAHTHTHTFTTKANLEFQYYHRQICFDLENYWIPVFRVAERTRNSFDISVSLGTCSYVFVRFLFLFKYDIANYFVTFTFVQLCSLSAKAALDMNLLTAISHPSTFQLTGSHCQTDATDRTRDFLIESTYTVNKNTSALAFYP